MSDKKKPKSKSKPSAFSEAKAPSKPTAPTSTTPQPYKRDPARQRFLITIFLVIAIGGGILAMMLKNARLFNWNMSKVEQLTYVIKNEYTHERTAFTQGLFFDGDTMYESTGIYGESTMRIVDLESGEVKQRIVLPEKYFGEGATILNDKIYQLTWKEGKCFVYNRDLEKLDEFEYDTEGWGLTTDGTHLIMSDGGSKLIYRDPEDFSIVKKVFVKFGNQKVSSINDICLNELEYCNGRVYANHYRTDYIYEIDAESGQIKSRIDLSGLWPIAERPTKPQPGLLNGIAITDDERIFVTGKYCPTMFEIELATETQKKHLEKQEQREKQRNESAE